VEVNGALIFRISPEVLPLGANVILVSSDFYSPSDTMSTQARIRSLCRNVLLRLAAKIGIHAHEFLIPHKEVR
jgi:hypothetical protein